MHRRLNRVLVRLNGWPRRLAATLCFVAAAASALGLGGAPAARPAAAPPSHAARFPAPLAMPIRLDAALAASVRPGQRIDLLATPPEDIGASATASRAVTVVRRVRVIAVEMPSDMVGTSDEAVVVVAVDRTRALRLARYAGAVLLPAVAGYS